MSGVIYLNDAAAIRAIAERVGEIRLARVLAASRVCSALEATIRPLRDERLNSLVERLQARLSALLPARLEGGAE